MSQLTVGKDVLSYCTKCKLNLGHTIVAMKDAKHIAKVKCNTCNTIQAFKDASISSKQNKTRKKASGLSPSKVISVSDLWMEKMSSTKKKSTPYAMDQKFVQGDILDHVKFGPGIVEKVVDDKIEVIFRHEIKTLVHNKKM
ncbi:MAG: hypothetical protein V4598_11840 [Bdellovibrionota bacterium]